MMRNPFKIKLQHMKKKNYFLIGARSLKIKNTPKKRRITLSAFDSEYLNAHGRARGSFGIINSCIYIWNNFRIRGGRRMELNKL